jgi:hypothetical protein
VLQVLRGVTGNILLKSNVDLVGETKLGL